MIVQQRDLGVCEIRPRLVNVFCRRRSRVNLGLRHVYGLPEPGGLGLGDFDQVFVQEKLVVVLRHRENDRLARVLRAVKRGIYGSPRFGVCGFALAGVKQGLAEADAEAAAAHDADLAAGVEHGGCGSRRSRSRRPGCSRSCRSRPGCCDDGRLARADPVQRLRVVLVLVAGGQHREILRLRLELLPLRLRHLRPGQILLRLLAQSQGDGLRQRQRGRHRRRRGRSDLADAGQGGKRD